MPAPGVDFSSQAYWSSRFQTEISFEWLATTDDLVPLILETIIQLRNARPSRESAGPFNVLHFGCGTSSLGSDIARAASQWVTSAPDWLRVVDADYALASIHTQNGDEMPGSGVERIQLDVLDREDCARTAPPGGWDLLVDKSTADAISCGPDIILEGVRKVEPIEALCANLASVTRHGGRWVCISYSENRFKHLSQAGTRPHQWRVVEKKRIGGAYMPEGKRIRDEKGVERIVYEPETGVWVYVLERVGND